jgi:nitrogen fixation/metabolism regulation signal transduction histidine kinase
MALRWKLILALSTMVALSGTAALVALSINSEIRIQIAKIRQTVIEKAPGADDQSSLKTQAESEVRNIESLVQRANTILWSLALLTPAITCFIYHLISHPIGALKKYAQWISQGDFNTTVDLRSQDEFGQLARIFNQMTDDLRSKTVSKDYLDGILKSMVNTLIVLHPDRTIKSVNDATLTMLGYKESELILQMKEMVTVQQNDARVSGVVESLGGTSFTLELPMAGGRSYDHRSA